MKLAITIAALATLTACAQSPDAIAPVSMGGAFEGISCAQTRTLLTNERQNLASLEAQQRSAVTGDAVGVFLIGVPTASLFGGNKAGLIGASKGKVIALENRLTRC